jgi:hypothetical protein
MTCLLHPKKEKSMSAKTSKSVQKAPEASVKAKSKEVAPKKAPAAKVSPAVILKKSKKLPVEDRHRIVAETAYFIAERRGFSNGCCEDDWYEAERMIESIFR